MPVLTGFTERTKGKVAVGGIAMGGAAPHAGGRFSLEVTIAVTAVATTDIVASVPAGATLLGASCYTTTAFGAVTAANLTVGATAGAAEYIASVDIKSAVFRPALTLVTTSVAALLSMPAPPNLFIRITQTGGNSATGAASLFIDFTT